MEVCSIVYNLISSFLFYTFFAILVAHAITFLLRKIKPSPRINTKSTVVIIGGCMGIGRQMAIQIAQNYQSKLLILDLRE